MPSKKELSQLYDLNHEISLLQKQESDLEIALRATMVSDTISDTAKGSGISYPFILHNITIQGIGDQQSYFKIKSEILDVKNLIRLNQEKCISEYNRLNRYIQGVDDSMIRQILTYRYVNGISSWQQIAMLIGGNNTADGVRMMHNRFLKSQ